MTEAAADVTGGMNFRIADADDVPRLAAFNQQLIDDERHRDRMSLAELEQRMSAFLRADYQAAIFELGGDPIGYALFRPEPEHLYLRQFYIRPDMRRRGCGRCAMTWFKQLAWRNHSRIRVDVLITNTAALAFWRSVGFSDYCLTLECGHDDPPASPTAPAMLRR